MYEPTRGQFYQNLTKTNRQIRAGRAASIAEDLHMQYRREIENMELELRRYERDLHDMLDLHPDSAFGLKVATDFKAEEFVAKRLELVVKIRNLKIRLTLAQHDFNGLFGDAGGDPGDPDNGIGNPGDPIDPDAELNVDFDPIDEVGDVDEDKLLERV